MEVLPLPCLRSICPNREPVNSDLISQIKDSHRKQITPSFPRSDKRCTLDRQKEHYSAKVTSHLEVPDCVLDYKTCRKIAVETGISENTTFRICHGLATVDPLLTEVRPGYTVTRTVDLAWIHRTHCECCPPDHLYVRRTVTDAWKTPDNWKLSYSLAQDVHNSVCFTTGQAETLDPFQRASAHHLLPQQPNIDAYLVKLPHCKGRLVALQAVHSPDTRVSGLGATSIIRSKSMKSARRNKDSLRRRRLTHSQKVLPWQATLDVQISNPSMSFAKKQEILTYNMPACYLPSTIHKSNTTQLQTASVTVVQNPQTRADRSAINESVSTEAVQYYSQHLPTYMYHANFSNKLVWHVMYKSAVHDSHHLLMSWPLDHVERTLLATPTTPCLACLTALRMTVTDHFKFSKMHLQETLKCMASYLLAFTLLTGKAAKFLLMTIWVSLAMFATALQTTHPGTDRRQIRTPWLAQMIQCIAHMVWLLLMILRHAASSVHSIAAMYSAIMFVKTQHALVMYILVFQIMCAIMHMTPVIMLIVRQTMQLMLPHNPRCYRKFAHPKLRGGRYWRRITYIRRKRQSQVGLANHCTSFMCYCHLFT